MLDWTGVFPAATTKLKADGAIDLAATQAGVDRMIKGGVSAIIALPMLGEHAMMDAAEKTSVLEAVREAIAGRVPMLSGLAEASTAGAVAAAKRFAGLGAEGFMLFPSLAYRTDARETVAWVEAVARATDRPILLYNNPAAFGVDFAPDILERLAGLPTVAAVKEETGDIRRQTDLHIQFGKRYAVFCGVDDLIYESVATGAVGWVPGMANAWPRECVRLFELCRARRLDDALALQRALTPAFHLDAVVKLVHYVKLAEHMVYGAPEHCRAPRLPLIGEERARVTAVIEKTIADLAALPKGVLAD